MKSITPTALRTEKGHLVISYYKLEIAFPDKDGEFFDEDFCPINSISIEYPFADIRISRQEAERQLTSVYGPMKLLGMSLRRQFDAVTGELLWLHPCVATEAHF